MTSDTPGPVNVPELCSATQRSESSHHLMPARYAEAALGQCEVPRFEIPNTRGQTSTHSSCLYACFAVKCRRIRDHRLFMPSTMSAAKPDCAKGQICSVNVWGFIYKLKRHKFVTKWLKNAAYTGTKLGYTPYTKQYWFM